MCLLDEPPRIRYIPYKTVSAKISICYFRWQFLLTHPAFGGLYPRGCRFKLQLSVIQVSPYITTTYNT